MGFAQYAKVTADFRAEAESELTIKTGDAVLCMLRAACCLWLAPHALLLADLRLLLKTSKGRRVHTAPIQWRPVCCPALELLLGMSRLVWGRSERIG